MVFHGFLVIFIEHDRRDQVRRAIAIDVGQRGLAEEPAPRRERFARTG